MGGCALKNKLILAALCLGWRAVMVSRLEGDYPVAGA